METSVESRGDRFPAGVGAGAPSLIVLDDVEVVYDRAILAVRGVSLAVPEGAIVALIGANGAGKTTTLKAISNLIRAERGEVSRGSIRLRGSEIVGTDPEDLVRRGVVHVLEGRHVFPHLSVEENLLTGAFVRRPSRRALAEDLERIYTWFPRLKVRRKSQAGLTSGGEQQMIAIGRGLMTRPKLVLLDEPSMGLAPMVVEEIFGMVRALNRAQGVSFLVAEQNAMLALKTADWGYVLDTGRVVTDGPAADLLARDDIKNFYLGDGGASFASLRRRAAR